MIPYYIFRVLSHSMHPSFTTHCTTTTKNIITQLLFITICHNILSLGGLQSRSTIHSGKGSGDCLIDLVDAIDTVKGPACRVRVDMEHIDNGEAPSWRLCKGVVWSRSHERDENRSAGAPGFDWALTSSRGNRAVGSPFPTIIFN